MLGLVGRTRFLCLFGLRNRFMNTVYKQNKCFCTMSSDAANHLQHFNCEPVTPTFSSATNTACLKPGLTTTWYFLSPILPTYIYIYTA